MGFRFRRSIKLAPGLRLNAGRRGFSLSAGARGASINMGSRGVYGNVGLPGTGLSYRERLGGSGRRSSRPRTPSETNVEVRVDLQEDGSVQLLDASGNPVPPKLVKAVREQHGDAVRGMLEQQCERWNQGIEAILNLHLATPAPDQRTAFQPEPFALPAPAAPIPEPIGFLAKLVRSRREAIEARNAAAQAEYEKAQQQWLAAGAEHERVQAAHRALLARARSADAEAMQEVLEARLGEVEWPRETDASFEVAADGQTVWLDVDLPEIEDMPEQQASVAARGFKLNIKDRSDTQRRKEYMAHVHAIGFRVIGETFNALPSVQEVIFSGYSQRAEPATGRVRDDYLYSVRVSRDEWQQIDFHNLEALDLPLCFERFDLRRKMTKTGVFTPIDPLGGKPDDAYPLF